jgi:hypothetical protein
MKEIFPPQDTRFTLLQISYCRSRYYSIHGPHFRIESHRCMNIGCANPIREENENKKEDTMHDIGLLTLKLWNEKGKFQPGFYFQSEIHFR